MTESPKVLSRFYLLSLLSEKVMTCKQIIEETEKRSKGAWKPSADSVDSALGKLLSEGLIEQVEGGYKTSGKGEGIFKLLYFS
jgi:DNA-binding PadR family transcriptional regulator